MTVHSYSEQPRARFAIVNNENIREGQLLSPGLAVEQITRSGVIFIFQGHRFLLEVNENF
jgi:hypothetical protein